MARSLSVKVPTADLIAQVEQKIVEIVEAIANYPQAKQQYEIDKVKHKQTIVAIATKSLAEKPELIGENYDSPIRLYTNYSGGVVAEFDPLALGFPPAPVAPENPNEKSYVRGGGYTTKLETLEKTLKVLKMTKQEEVSASTYNSVMELL